MGVGQCRQEVGTAFCSDTARLQVSGMVATADFGDHAIAHQDGSRSVVIALAIEPADGCDHCEFPWDSSVHTVSSAPKEAAQCQECVPATGVQELTIYTQHEVILGEWRILAPWGCEYRVESLWHGQCEKGTLEGMLEV